MKKIVLSEEEESLFYSGKDISKMFGIDRSTVDSWVRQGILTKIKIGRRVFFNRSEVNALAGV